MNDHIIIMNIGIKLLTNTVITFINNLEKLNFLYHSCDYLLESLLCTCCFSSVKMWRSFRFSLEKWKQLRFSMTYFYWNSTKFLILECGHNIAWSWFSLLYILRKKIESHLKDEYTLPNFYNMLISYDFVFIQCPIQYSLSS